MIMQLFLKDVHRYLRVKCYKAYIFLSKGSTKKYILKYTHTYNRKREIKLVWEGVWIVNAILLLRYL